MNRPRELKISLWKLKALGWIGAGFFTAGLIGSWMSGQKEVSPWFIPFILLSVPVLVQAGTIRCDPRFIYLSIPLGDFEIEWAEIKRVERGKSFIVFIAGDKRLNIPTPEWWAGDDQAAFGEVIDRFLAEQSIEVEQSFMADFRFPKNTKKSNNS